jgi:hypothetical protein
MAASPASPKSPPPAPQSVVLVRDESGNLVELPRLPAKVLIALNAWLERLITLGNGGYGEIWLEVVGGEIKRIKPTESWMASML